MTTSEQFDERLAHALDVRAQQATIRPDAWSEFERRYAAAATPEPKQRHSHRGAWLAVAATVAVVGGAVAIGPTLLSPEAYASWHSEPDALTNADATAVASACHAAHPVSMDRRGANVYLLSEDTSSWTSCVATLPHHADEGLGTTYVSTEAKRAVNTTLPSAAEPLTVIAVKAPEGNHVKGEPQPLSYVSGRAAPQVGRVVISSSKGSITATLRDGYYSAWWPGNDTDTAVVRAYGADGHLVSQVGELTRTPR